MVGWEVMHRQVARRQGDGFSDGLKPAVMWTGYHPHACASGVLTFEVEYFGWGCGDASIAD